MNRILNYKLNYIHYYLLYQLMWLIILISTIVLYINKNIIWSLPFVNYHFQLAYFVTLSICLCFLIYIIKSFYRFKILKNNPSDNITMGDLIEISHLSNDDTKSIVSSKFSSDTVIIRLSKKRK